MLEEKQITIFLTLQKMTTFFFQKFVIFNMITYSFLVEKQGTLSRARRYISKNLLNLDCQDIILDWIFEDLFKNFKCLILEIYTKYSL